MSIIQMILRKQNVILVFIFFLKTMNLLSRLTPRKVVDALWLTIYFTINFNFQINAAFFSVVSKYVYSGCVMPFYYALEKSVWLTGAIYHVKHIQTHDRNHCYECLLICKWGFYCFKPHIISQLLLSCDLLISNLWRWKDVSLFSPVG